MNFSKIKTSLAAIAFVLAIVAAFAFKTSEEAVATQWYAVETDGDILTPALSSKPACESGMQYCAVEFDESDINNGQPPIQNVEEPDADDYIVDLTFRN